MATDGVTTPAQKAMTPRRVGERFMDPERGELLVVDHSGCDGCVYLSRRNNSNRACYASERRGLTGSCIKYERPDGKSVQFVKPNDYAVFKLTGEWP